MKKIDMHLHLGRKTLSHDGKIMMSGYQDMLPHLAELGIGKGVLMSVCETPSVKMPLGSCADNAAIAAADPEHYVWMCNLDPVHPETVYDRLANYKAMGAVGVGELMINERLDSPFLQAVFTAAEQLGLPVTFHMSPEVGFSYGVVDDPGLPLLEKTLQAHPGLKILGHSQSFWIEISGDAPTDRDGRNSWGSGPVVPGGRVPELFDRYENLCGDLSANSAGCAIMRDPDFGLAFLEKYADRLFFATDMVTTDMVFPLGAWLDEQHAAGRLSTAAYEKICRGNAERVFGL